MFTADEDIKLKDAVHALGDKSWFAIAVLIPGRTKIQCRNRWHGVLDPNIVLMWGGRNGLWEDDEDINLEDAVPMIGRELPS